MWLLLSLTGSRGRRPLECHGIGEFKAPSVGPTRLDVNAPTNVMLEPLPEDFDPERVMHDVYFRAKLERAEQAIQRGDVVNHEEVVARSPRVPDSTPTAC
jgi:hypothetical protein